MQQHSFKSTDNIYQQTEESTMGNSLFSFIPNLFMGNFATDLKNILAYLPRVWVRYIDDIFCVLDTSKSSITNFFPIIKF